MLLFGLVIFLTVFEATPKARWARTRPGELMNLLSCIMFWECMLFTTGRWSDGLSYFRRKLFLARSNATLILYRFFYLIYLSIQGDRNQSFFFSSLNIHAYVFAHTRWVTIRGLARFLPRTFHDCNHFEKSWTNAYETVSWWDEYIFTGCGKANWHNLQYWSGRRFFE